MQIIGRIYSLIFLLVYSFVTSAINIFLPIAADYYGLYSRMNFIVERTVVVIFLGFVVCRSACNYRDIDEKGTSKVNISFIHDAYFDIDVVINFRERSSIT